MKILDLTHLIEEAMPVYPETEPPKLTPSNTFEQHGFRETLLTMGSHTGTHMDAPAHMLRDGKTLDQFPADKYIGTAYVLDCSDLAGKEIPKARLQLHASEIEAADFLLFYTGWGKPFPTRRSPCASRTLTARPCAPSPCRRIERKTALPWAERFPYII